MHALTDLLLYYLQLDNVVWHWLSVSPGFDAIAFYFNTFFWLSLLIDKFKWQNHGLWLVFKKHWTR